MFNNGGVGLLLALIRYWNLFSMSAEICCFDQTMKNARKWALIKRGCLL